MCCLAEKVQERTEKEGWIGRRKGRWRENTKKDEESVGPQSLLKHQAMVLPASNETSSAAARASASTMASVMCHVFYSLVRSYHRRREGTPLVP